MKIAVTYKDGEIFQHFGHSEQFKVYEIENNTIVSSLIIEAGEQGHGALAALLEAQDIDVIICGGIGEGAVAALLERNIEVCAGQEGDADAAVEAYLRGELVDSGVNCNHHSHEEENSCGSACGSSCGSGCGGGCGGCHPGPSFEGPNVGRKVRAHYRGTFNDGTQFDSSYDRGEPLEFICGAGMMIEGFDRAVATLGVGEVVDIHLMPKEAYGEADPDAIFPVNFEDLPGASELEVGETVMLQNIYGQPFRVKVVAKDETSVTFDANHEMAGKELNFRIELVEVL